MKWFGIALQISAQLRRLSFSPRELSLLYREIPVLRVSHLQREETVSQWMGAWNRGFLTGFFRPLKAMAQSAGIWEGKGLCGVGTDGSIDLCLAAFVCVLREQLWRTWKQWSSQQRPGGLGR